MLLGILDATIMDKIFADFFTFLHNLSKPQMNLNYNHDHNFLRLFDG